jgi:signal transduction histidine kinase
VVPDSRFRRALRWESAHLPWSAQTFRDMWFIATNVPLSLITPVVLVASLLAFLPEKFRPMFFDHHTLLAGAAAVIVPSVAVLAIVPVMTAAQRRRFSSIAGIDLSSPMDPTRRRGVVGVPAWLRRASTWRQLAYHLVAAPVLIAGGLAAIGLLGSSVVSSPVSFGYWMLSHPASSGEEFKAHATHQILFLNLTWVGLALVLVSPWLITMFRRLDTRAAAALLGPTRTEQRLAHVTESRSGLVEAADAERRRIERDLHDGTQARLVSLAMTLGVARATRTDVPDDVMSLITDAHEQTIKTIEELRDVIRGLHPASLDELGLPHRASPTVEAVAYFVVSEALANITKHAAATRAEVIVERRGDTMRLLVIDDGVGGADPTRGSGINGLAQRVRSVDGELHTHSPPGGPTTICVEMPCES